MSLWDEAGAGFLRSGPYDARGRKIVPICCWQGSVPRIFPCHGKKLIVRGRLERSAGCRQLQALLLQLHDTRRGEQSHGKLRWLSFTAITLCD